VAHREHNQGGNTVAVGGSVLKLAGLRAQAGRSIEPCLRGCGIKDSGLLRGWRAIHGGRKEVRGALYIAVLALSRRASRFALAYRALLARGKPKKLALTAVMRKLLVTLNAIARTSTPWRDQPPPATA